MSERSTHTTTATAPGLAWTSPRGRRRTTLPSQLDIRQIDDDLELMEQSYRLRYQVYCLERGFLDSTKYPDQLERDEFDRYSVHAGVVSPQQRLVGTLRLVQLGVREVPLYRHCEIFADDIEALSAHGVRLAEVSRLCMSRQSRDDHAGNSRVALHLFRAGYQTSKRKGMTHWVAAMEPSLQRLLAAVGVPFRIVGPITDYFGPVAPYMCDLHQFDEIILAGTRPRLRTFLEGLEPQFHPGAVMGVV